MLVHAPRTTHHTHHFSRITFHITLMSKDRSLVRASDIGAWTFCNRAWWLAHVQKAEHEDPTVLVEGNRAHAVHGRSLLQAAWLRHLGVAFFVGGFLLAAAALLLQFFTG
jgi:hypothetical protein